MGGMFKRKRPEPPKLTDQEWKAWQQTILADGPGQPCMSSWTYDPMGYCRIKCQRDIAASSPHEHRALSVGNFRESTPWLTGGGNPWETEDREQANKEWLVGD